jgi:nicotinate phosphoribosyltransferase
VGTSLVTGSGAPTAALVYKLVARSDTPMADGTAFDYRELRPVAKRSVGKPGRGGRKWAVRERSASGEAATERILLAPPADPRPTGRVLLQELVSDGKITGREPLAEARSRHTAVLAELPSHAMQLSRGYPAIPTIFGHNGEEA